MQQERGCVRTAPSPSATLAGIRIGSRCAAARILRCEKRLGGISEWMEAIERQRVDSLLRSNEHDPVEQARPPRRPAPAHLRG
jgi:hypothetical protein